MKIEVRPLRDTDIEELSRIEAASFSMPWSAEDFRGLLLRDYCLYVVAETDGHIAGCAGLTDSFHEGNIDNVVTAPEYRNLGVGSKMLEELLRLGAERGESRRGGLPQVDVRKAGHRPGESGGRAHRHAVCAQRAGGRPEALHCAERV